MAWWIWMSVVVVLVVAFFGWRVFNTGGSMLAVQDLEAAAVAYMQQGRYDKAEPVLRQALEIATSNMSEANIAPVQINLARALAGQGQFDAAESQARQGLEILKRTHGPTNTLVVYSLKLLAEISKAKGDVSSTNFFLREAADALAQEETKPELGNPEMREALRKSVEHAISEEELSPNKAN